MGENADSPNTGMVTLETKVPRKQSAVWVAMKSVKTNLSLTEKGASPVNWKVIFLVFISLVSTIHHAAYGKCSNRSNKQTNKP